MNNRIYPLAYKLTPGQTKTLYYLQFPKAWKTILLDIAQKNNPRFKDEYGLPTNTLKKLVDSWMDGVISLAPLKKDSHDEHWLTSCKEYSEHDIEILYSLIKVWVTATYISSPRTLPMVQKLARDFCDTIRPEDLKVSQTKADICLTLEDGTVREEAYQAIPLLVINRLLGQEIVLNGQTFQLAYSGKNRLISQPITAPKNCHQYSFVFDFSVQTTPPQRRALLLCQMSIRRWIPDCKNKEREPFVSENINAHIKVSETKYCQVPIAYDPNMKRLDWKSQDKECYNIWGYEALPSASDVLMNPTEYKDHILLPYKNGMSGFIASKIGTGVSVVDKAALYQEIYKLLADMVCEQPDAVRVSHKGQNLPTFNSPQEYSSPEEFRSWVRQCANTDRIVFEFYGLWREPDQRQILEQIKTKLLQDFGENSLDSCMEIQYVDKEIGNLANALSGDGRDIKIQRCEEIVQELGHANAVAACFFVLPGQESYDKGDPKQVLRNAFARTGRVVQFITPESEPSKNKIENAVYDLYRQLGIVTLLQSKKKFPALANIPCVGMHLCTQIHGITKKARFLPIYVTIDLTTGKTRVHCDAFSNRAVSYREACLEMAQLFWKNDLEQCCMEASRAPARQKMIELKNQYYEKEDGVLLVVQSDGNTRALWSGISDKEIGEYSLAGEYDPVQINVGMPKSPIPFSLQNTGIRIVRIRSNQEVPDYFTELSQKSSNEHIQYASVSGVFQYGKVFWGIHPRPNDPQYTSSFKTSRITHPLQRFSEKDMIELYPLQLQSGDNAIEWILYVNALRHIPIQYNQSTILPLPLHLAKALEEYLFDA